MSLNDVTPRVGRRLRPLRQRQDRAESDAWASTCIGVIDDRQSGWRHHDGDADLERLDLPGGRSAPRQLQARLRSPSNLQQNASARHRREPQLRPADVDSGVQRGHALRLGQPCLQLGVLDQRAARAGAAPRHRRRLLPALVRQLPGHAASRASTAADFDPYSVTAPLDSRLPDGGGYAISGLYNLNPRQVRVGTTTTRRWRSDFGEQTEHWNGVDCQRQRPAARTASCCRAASAPAAP